MVFTLFTLNAYLWLLELFWVGWQRGIWFWSGPDLWELKELNGPELSPQLSQTSSEGRYDLGEGEGDELCGRDALEDVSDLEGAEWKGLKNDFDLEIADLPWSVSDVGLELLEGFQDSRDSLKMRSLR